jgi:flagellar basal-body rod protein FlgF
MIQGIYESAAATDGLQTWNDVIARNLSAASTPGFKRDVVLFDGVLSGVMAYGPNDARPLEQGTMIPLARGGVNFNPGELRRSGDPFEFAIEGRGFFRLQRPDGEFVYTRDGQFRASADGRLQSKQGYDVVGDSGPIQLLIDGGPMTIDAEGRVRQGDQEIGVLTVFDFQDLAGLRRTTGGFVVDSANPQFAQPVENANIQQGFVELSNVSPMHEMANLVTINNALQANQRVLQTYDSLTDRAVQVLGNTQG